MGLKGQVMQSIFGAISKSITTPVKALAKATASNFKKINSEMTGINADFSHFSSDLAKTPIGRFASMFKKGARSTRPQKIKVQKPRPEFLNNKFFNTLGSMSATAGRTMGNATSKGASLAGKGIKYAATSSKLQYGVVIGAGLVYGGMKAAVSNANERTANMNARGMSANNLGTDGLTLALSRRRHR